MRWMILAVGGLVACTGDDPGNGEDTGAESNAEVEFAPVEGDWVEDPAVYSEDGCEMEQDVGAESSPFVLTVTGTGTFEMFYATSDPSLDDTTITCTLVDRAFTCDPLTQVTDFADYGYDGVFTVNADASGTFSSETEGHVDVNVSATCVGADCATFLPVGDCTSTGGYDMHKTTD